MPAPIMLALALAASLDSPTLPYAHCGNCSVTVTLDLGVADELLQRASVNQSMPLGGEVMTIRWGAGIAVVEIGTTEDYAAFAEVDSFDVAKRVQALTADWAKAGKIELIEAAVGLGSPD